MFEEIIFKDGFYIKILDFNQLTQSQIERIRRVASLKTRREWLEAKEGVKIDLEEEQRSHAIYTKDVCFEGKTAIEVLLSDLVEFKIHASKRTAWRIANHDPDSPLSIETKLKVIDAIIRSEEVAKQAEWKGYPQLSYNFISDIDGEQVNIVLSFRENICLVTVYGKSQKREYGSTIRELLGHNHPLVKKIRKTHRR
ncbi:hypothetical protein AM501_02410 [Aneurinibacillus migulanus]|uniref:hypothetical protein n=1 Tax=Aneurinibacillus migulanus TaxID=47500 RepID=UPI0005BE1185|nr:hypothetical protein [Aneurinibacillus migulanus]KIV52283.1 hypothetical protein TS64_22700 [Aneurinibacillus migulanus]KPD09729.1 hypothetical protein AM501_02410 [Aneurinibacillus migulanus]